MIANYFKLLNNGKVLYSSKVLDASLVRVATVLSHIINNVEKPIAFASHSLNKAERNYSQPGQKALSIIFGVSHFFDYLYNRHSVLITDNQPLSRIFHRKTSLQKLTSAQLLCYVSYLIRFDYTVKFRKGLENQNRDCLSRAAKPELCICRHVYKWWSPSNMCMNYFWNVYWYSNCRYYHKRNEKDQELAQIKQIKSY